MTSIAPSRSSIRFRPMTDADVPFFRYLYGTTREMEMQHAPWTEEQKAAFLDLQFKAQKDHYDEYYAAADFLVIEMDARAVGRLYIDRGPEVIEVIDIALLPEIRGRGIGRMLLEEILDEARSTGKEVQIYVENFNPARHLYDRLGFRHVDDNGVYHRMIWNAK